MRNKIIIGFILLSSALSMISCVSKQDNENTDIIKTFLSRVKKQDLNSRQIIDTFMMENPSSDYIKTQEFYIPEFKKELEKIDLEALKIIPYSEVNKKYQTILNEDVKQKDIYGILYKDSVFHFILMDKKRIKSFSTMKFGSHGDDKANRIFVF